MFKKFFSVFLVCLSISFFSSVAFSAEKKSSYNIIEDSEGVYVVEVDTKKAKKKLVPYVAEDLMTVSDVYDKTGAKFVVNAGFFDMQNSKTVSYVLIDKKVVLNPMNNENLIGNKALNPFLGKILNRSEFRIIKDDKGDLYYDIAPHDVKVEEGHVLKHSIQAGPMLLPKLQLEEEFFILTDNGKVITEKASALIKRPRTAIGVKDNNVYLFIITSKSPMTLEEVANLAKKYEMQKAMAFDGGGSTSFAAKELYVVSENNDIGRKVKSFLIFK